MDLGPALRDLIVQIRNSIDALATSKGWTRDDYRIDMIVNKTWGNILISVISTEYTHERMQSPDAYDEVYDRLENDLRDNPGVYESISVLLWPRTSEEAAPSNSLDDSHIRIDGALLNPGVNYAGTLGQI